MAHHPDGQSPWRPARDDARPPCTSHGASSAADVRVRTEPVLGASPSSPAQRSPGATAAHAGALLVAAGAAGAVAYALGRWALSLAPGVPGPWAFPAAWIAPGGPRVEDLVARGVVLLGCGVAAWFCLALLVAATCAGARAVGHVWVAGEGLVGRAAPVVVRRALVLSAGTGIALGAGLPAVALAPPPFDDLGWTVTTEGAPEAAPGPDGAGGPSEARVEPVSTAPAPPAAELTSTSGGAAAADLGAAGGTAEPGPDVVTVRPGDTLWDIARGHLPAGATVADVAAAWPAWYAANAEVVGSDPDLIHPGQRLVRPAASAVTSTADTAPGAAAADGAADGGADGTADGTDR